MIEGKRERQREGERESEIEREREWEGKKEIERIALVIALKTFYTLS